MTPTTAVTKEFKLEEFINHIISDQLREFIYNTEISPYFKFLTLPQYMEFLGACIDEHPFICDDKSKSRFNSVLKNYFKIRNSNYLKHSNNSTSWDLYKDFRCGVVHQLRPINKVVFTTRIEAIESENKHLEIDMEHGMYLVLVLEDLFDDIVRVSEMIINDYKNKKFNSVVNTKWGDSHISIIDDGGM